MEVEKLLKEKEEYITRLENCLLSYEDVSDRLLEETVKIVDDVDEKGKKIFSNEQARIDELKKRLPKDFFEKRKLKISIEIIRLKIDFLSENIKFYSK